MLKNKTIFDIIDQGLNNNGTVSLQLQLKSKSKTSNDLDLKNELFYYFKDTLLLDWLIPSIISTDLTNLKKSEKDYIDRIELTAIEDTISFNLYEFLFIKKEFQNKDSLNKFNDFFTLLKKHLMFYGYDDCISFVNEQRPLRLEILRIKDKELENEIVDFINKTIGYDWSLQVAKGLNKLSLYSSFIIRETGFLSVSENREFFNKFY